MEAAAADRLSEFRRIFADEPSFRAWYDVAAPRLYRYLLGRCAGDVALAEDLSQQAFVEAVRHRNDYDGRADGITWLIAIGRNKLIDHMRRLERDERKRLRLVVREIPARTVDPWTVRDDRADVLNALRGLPAAQRTAVILHHADGLPVRDVAKALGRTEGAVEALLSRGRARFRALYEEHDRG